MNILVTVIVVPDGDQYMAYCPAFRGLLMDGSTIEEALDRTAAGLALYLDSLRRHDDPLPVGPYCVVDDAGPRQAHWRAPPDALVKNLEVPWALSPA